MSQLELWDRSTETDRKPDLRRQLARQCEVLVRDAGGDPPVDPRVLASMRGIAEIRTAEQRPSGFLFRLQTGRLAVHLRKQDSPIRQRFTLFHEIAHTLLPGFGSVPVEYRCHETSAEPKEQLANYAAAEMLFPYRYFEGDLGFYSYTLHGLEQLARRYEASLEATAIHMTDRWPDPAMCLVAKRSATARTSLLPIHWTHSRGTWPLLPSRRQIETSGALTYALAEGLSERAITIQGDHPGVVARVHVSAKAYPYTAGDVRQHRVIALVTPIT